MARPSIYHRTLSLLIAFSALSVLAFPACAVESVKLLQVWPVGQKQQYVYVYEGHVIGEQWMELRKIPRTKGRYEMVNTIDVDGTPRGSPWSSSGESICELDEWGRPIAYDALVHGADNSTRRVRMTVNGQQVDFWLTVNDGKEQNYAQPANDDMRLVDFIFVGPYDLAFRLQPLNPQASTIRRSWVVPNMQMNLAMEIEVLYEETITTPLGEEYPTVRLNLPGLLLHVWVAPGGKLVKALIHSPRTIVWAGETVPPSEPDEPE